MQLPYPELIERSVGLIEIIWVNAVLSGDNAVVIALACRGLPPDRRRLGMTLGAGVAVLMRIALTAIVSTLLETPFLKIVGGVLLLWVGAKVVVDEDETHEGRVASDRLWPAIRTIAIADVVMSLDNVLAIAAASRGSTVLLVTGLAISIPLIVAGATLVMGVLERFPVLIWAGAVLLGWLAGEMVGSDPFVLARLGPERAATLAWPAPLAGVALVLLAGAVLRRLNAPKRGL